MTQTEVPQLGRWTFAGRHPGAIPHYLYNNAPISNRRCHWRCYVGKDLYKVDEGDRRIASHYHRRHSDIGKDRAVADNVVCVVSVLSDISVGECNAAKLLRRSFLVW